MKKLHLVDIIERQGENKYSLLFVDELNRALSINTGFTETWAIIIALKKVKPSRPSTFNLLCKIIDEGGFNFTHTHITEVTDNIFYSNFQLEKKGKDYKFDCRPSDGIALSIRYSSPIYINEELMKEFAYQMAQKISVSNIKQKGIQAIVNKFNHKDKENKRLLKNASKSFITEMTKEIVNSLIND